VSELDLLVYVLPVCHCESPRCHGSIAWPVMGKSRDGFTTNHNPKLSRCHRAQQKARKVVGHIRSWSMSNETTAGRSYCIIL